MSESAGTATQTPGPSGRGDSPKLGEILKLAIRTLPYLKDAVRDVKRLAIVGIPIALALVPIGMQWADLVWNRLLNGEPLNALQASVLGLSKATFVDVEALSVEARQQLRGRLVLVAAVATAIVVPIGLGLFVWVIRLIQRINQSLRMHMMGQVQAMSMRHHSGTRVGDSIYHAYQDSAMVTNLMAMLVRPIIPLIRAVFLVFLVYFLDWQLTAMLAVIYVVAFLLGRYFGARLRVEFRRARETNTRLTARIQETMSGIKVVKAFGIEDHEQADFDRYSRDAFAAAFKARALLAAYGIVSFFFSAIPPLLAACYLAFYASEKFELVAGAALAFTGFAVWNLGAYKFATARMDSAAGAVRGLLGMWGITQDMTVGMERAFSQVDLKPEVQNADDAVAFPGLQDEVSFENVSFAYQPERPVLQNVALTARAGTITALVGPTGSGKSTLVSLLLRLFDPDAGCIKVDGKDIRGFTLESLRDNISIALQENLLFGTSIRENIRYAVPEASDETVRAAARVACADEYIMEQPEGYDTPLGERGTKLSTGQRQRLSIARAVIKDTPVLILDEPTASLDADTELRVLQNLSEWGKGRAIFIITHRLSTIRQADHIVYLRDGKIEEQGSHDALMVREGGAYRRFVELEEGSREQPPTVAPALNAAGGAK